MSVDWHVRIVIDPEVRSGQPTIRGMRVTVKDVLGFLASGMSVDEILREYPYLEEEDVYAPRWLTQQRSFHSPAA
jgi:uncharacterized protein (DUF433 family)